MDDENQDSAHDLNIKNTTEESFDRPESPAINNIIINIEDSEQINNEDISKEIPAIKIINPCKDNITSSNNDVIINFGGLIHNDLVHSKDVTKGITTNTKETNQHRGINTALLEVFNYNANVKEMLGGKHEPEGEPLDYAPDRNGFVLRVFILTFIMLIITAGFIACVIMVEPVTLIFLRFAKIFLYTGIAMIIAMSYAMCLSECFRRMPCVIFVLILTVVGYCMICGAFSVYFSTMIILTAFGITCIIVIICMILACTPFDFTRWYLFVVAILGVIFLVGMVMMIMRFAGVQSKEFTIFRLVFLIVACLMQSVMLVIELQMILGGKAIEISENEICFAAYMLYNSILDIFLKLVQIIGIIDYLG